MIKESLIEPFIKTVDKVIFGFEEINEIEKEPEFIKCDNEDEYDAQRSIN